MKKLLSMLLALTMVFSLAACGGDDTGTDTEPDLGEAGNTEPVVLTMLQS